MATTDPITTVIGAAADAVRHLLDDAVLADLSMAVVAANEGSRNLAAGCLLDVNARIAAAQKIIEGALALHAMRSPK